MASGVARVRRILQQAVADNLTGESAKVAYYAFLSLFPLILSVFALTGLLGGERAFAWIMGQVVTAVPGETAAYLERFVREVTLQERPDVLSFGILGTLWAASGIFAALADGLNTVYHVRERRPFWKKRLLALALLLVGAVLMIGAAVLILAGPELARWLRLGFAWQLARWPVSFLPLLLLLWLIYYFLPARDQRHCRRPVLAGAAVGALAWVAATALFRLYVANFGSYSQTYGFVGAVMVLLLWLYITALAILFGGEVAAALEGLPRDSAPGMD